MNNTPKTDVIERIKYYLLSGGIWNPELAIHDNVRDLIIDCQTEIERLQSERDNAIEFANSRIQLTNNLYLQITDLLDERDKLKDWKESALVEFSKIQTQEIGKEIGAILGSSIHEQILPAIKNLKNECNEAKRGCKLLANNATVWKDRFDEAMEQNAKLREIVEKAIKYGEKNHSRSCDAISYGGGCDCDCGIEILREEFEQLK